MTSTGAEAAGSTGAMYDLRTQGRVGAWILCSLIPILCVVAALPGIYFAFYLGAGLFYAGPVIGLVVIVGGELHRRRIRRELRGSDAGLTAAASAVQQSVRVGSDEQAEDAAGAESEGPEDAHRAVSERILRAAEAADFRTTRQIALFLCYALIGVLAVAAGIGLAVGDSLVWMLSLGPLAFLGLTVVCMAPGWAFSRSIVVGEEHALLSHEGSWRQIRALRILSVVVGGCAIVASAFCAVALPLGILF